MGVGERLNAIFSNRIYAFLFFFSLAVVPCLVVWGLLPLDWNSDSYHH